MDALPIDANYRGHFNGWIIALTTLVIIDSRFYDGLRASIEPAARGNEFEAYPE